MWERLMKILRAIAGIFMEGAEGAVGEDRLLKEDRDDQADSVKKMGVSADKVGKFYQQTLDMQVEAQRRKADFLAEAEAALVAANAAHKAGKEEEALDLEEEAQGLINQAAEEDQYLAKLDEDMKDALSGHEQALEMYNRNRKNVEQLGQSDARLIAGDELTKMKEEMQLTLESTLSNVPKSTRDDIRVRIATRTKSRDQMNRSRQVRLEMLLKEENGKQRAKATRTTAASSAMMADLKKKAGYAAPEAAPAETSASEMAAKIAAMKKE